MAYLLFDPKQDAPQRVEAAHWRSHPGAYLLAIDSGNWYTPSILKWKRVPISDVPKEVRAHALLFT